MKCLHNVDIPFTGSHVFASRNGSGMLLLGIARSACPMSHGLVRRTSTEMVYVTADVQDYGNGKSPP